MTAIFEGEVLDIREVENGLIFAYCEAKDEEKITVAFKMFSFENSKTTNVAKNIYQLSKFGADYKAVSMQVDEYITCNIITFPAEQMLILENDGTIKVLSADATVIYKGKFSYMDESPSSVALFYDKIWCSYKNKNMLVRYNINTMREELRIGTGDTSPFSMPTHIFVDADYAFVCAAGKNQIIKVNLNTYGIEVYKEFELPVYKYFRFSNREIILNKNGIFMI